MYNRYLQVAINTFGSTYKKTNKNNEYIFPCPDCSRLGKSDKLYVNVENGVYHCFRCGKSGKLKAIAKLSDFSPSSKIKQSLPTKRHQNDILIPRHSAPLIKDQLNALHERGISDEKIKQYNISGSTETKRIIIPNKIIGSLTDIICKWEYRKDVRDKGVVKYLYDKIVETSSVLFNLHNIKASNDEIILCEGIFNAITAGNNAIASYGCNLSDIQAELLVKTNPKSIVISYDSDEAGVKGAENAIKKLKNLNYQGKVYYILLPKGIDINDMGYENYKKFLNENKVNIPLDSKISTKIPSFLFYK